MILLCIKIQKKKGNFQFKTLKFSVESVYCHLIFLFTLFYTFLITSEYLYIA